MLRVKNLLIALALAAILTPADAFAAISGTSVFNVQSAGADGNSGNGGGFDPGNASMATNLTATAANTASPVVASATYNFAARDVGAWLFIQSGTNWTPGWYKIASVASNQATLTAGIGTAVGYDDSFTSSFFATNTVAGCATVATPSAGVWSIDYSQGTAAGITYTDMVIQATTTQYTSAANPVGPNIVGNIIAVSSGTNFTVQRVQISSVSGTTATCDKSLGTAAATGGNGKLGGCLASPGQAGALMVGGNVCMVKTATYSITSATTNIAGGCPSLPANAAAGNLTRMVGYASIPGDMGAKPTFSASGIATFSLILLNGGCSVTNVIFNGNNLTAAKLTTLAGTGNRFYLCKVTGFNTASSLLAATTVAFCEVTANSAALSGGSYIGCNFHANTATPVSLANSSASSLLYCLSYSNTGASTDGFATANNASNAFGCVAALNGRDGFRWASGTNSTYQCFNCIASANTGFNYNATATFDGWKLVNCAGYSTGSGQFSGLTDYPGFITLTGDPFNNAAGGDFSLNNTAGAGAALRLAGVPGLTGTNLSFPGASTSSYLDVGAAQHPSSVPIIIGSWNTPKKSEFGRKEEEVSLVTTA